ncbi:integrase/recombinase XerD [Pseudomonas sp. LAIL14HWK12:I4]|uniref:tyrosine-type recombinase/integrase n=2 Tax=Pseudomonas TaxID=286 RepID=UPI000B501002|nr:site-specific integrase [Pseudomonas sp. URMO17WK12:I11]TFA88980.1 integrase/recombinase XerD [Pseudomonas sp. URIL14HWK12:I1]SNB73921.1 integrase/recombinase XerD [Pseudomonas sp. LAIL14HWK12:I4]
MAAVVDVSISIMETFRAGRPTYRMLSADVVTSEFFDTWIFELSKRQAWNTVKSYGPAVLLFIQYIQVVADRNGGLTPLLLTEAIEGYENFLAYGTGSSVKLSRSVARILGNRKMGGSSIRKHLTAVNNFIDASETFRKAIFQLQETGYVGKDLISALPAITSQYVAAPRKISVAIGNSSWLAGCIAGGAKRIRQVGLVATSKPSTMAHTDSYGGDEKVFPIDLCVKLIESATCLRDKTLWSLLAACGCRISEALTMFTSDVCIYPGKPADSYVQIIDPNSRIKELSRFMTDVAISKLSHKGRLHPETFLIEPFASHFWVNLDLYIAEQRALEMKRHRPVSHRFLFRNLLNGEGMPSSYQAVWERFNAAAKALTGESYGFHSLRHMYAYYLHNHCPNPFKPGAFGFELGVVQKLLGHSSATAVERYARKDSHMLRASMAAMNLMRMRDSTFNVAKVQIEHLRQQIAHLEKFVSSET